MYGVFRKSNAIGDNTSKPVATFDDKDAAKAYAKRRRQQLSRGERSYYKMSFVTKEIQFGK